MDTDQNKNAWLWLIGLLILAVTQVEAGASPAPTGTAAESKARLVETYGKLPLSFELNQGETDNQVRFLSRGPGYSVFLTATGAVLALRKAVADKADPSKSPVIPGKTEGRDPESREIQRNRDWMPASAGMTQSTIDADHKPAQTGTLRIQLLGANPKPRISGGDSLPGKATISAATTRRNGAPTSRLTPRSSMKTCTLASISSITGTSGNDFVVAPGGGS